MNEINIWDVNSRAIIAFSLAIITLIITFKFFVVEESSSGKIRKITKATG